MNKCLKTMYPFMEIWDKISNLELKKTVLVKFKKIKMN